MSEHSRCPNIYGKYGNIQNAFTKGVGLSFFCLFFFWGGGGTIFSLSRFIKAIISINMYIIRCPSVTLRSTRLPSFSF